MKLSRFFEKVQLRVWRALWYAFQSCRHGISEQGRSCGDRNPSWNQLAAEALRQNVLLTWLGSDGWLGSSKPQEKLGLLMAMVGMGQGVKPRTALGLLELSSPHGQTFLLVAPWRPRSPTQRQAACITVRRRVVSIGVCLQESDVRAQRWKRDVHILVLPLTGCGAFRYFLSLNIVSFTPTKETPNLHYGSTLPSPYCKCPRTSKSLFDIWCHTWTSAFYHIIAW